MKTCYILLCSVFASIVLANEKCPCRSHQELQILWSHQQQLRQGILRQRKMYPKSSAARIARAAGKKGMLHLLREHNLDKAIIELNKSWRFNPDEYLAYWGAGIICGNYMLLSDDKKHKIQHAIDSIELLRRALGLIPVSHEDYVDIVNDLAVSMASLGEMYVINPNCAEKGGKILDEADSIITEAIKKNPQKGRLWLTKAIIMFYKNNFLEADIALKEVESRGHHNSDLRHNINMHLKSY